MDWLETHINAGDAAPPLAEGWGLHCTVSGVQMRDADFEPLLDPLLESLPLHLPRPRARRKCCDVWCFQHGRLQLSHGSESGLAVGSAL